MKANRFFVLVLCLCLVLSLLSGASAADKAVASKWAAVHPTVDGKDNDWAGDQLTLEKNVSVNYAVRNDGENLYILFVFNDARYVSTLEFTGMTIYFNTQGKKDKSRGIRFKRKNATGDDLIAAMERQGMQVPEEKKAEYRVKGSRYILFDAEVINKKGEVIPFEGVSTGAADVPTFRAGRSGKSLVYEFRVPLAGADVHPAGIGAAPGKDIKVGFEWGGMTEEMKRMRMAEMSEAGTRARAPDISLEATLAGGAESSGEPGSPDMGAAMRRGPKKHSFWADVKLAVQN